MRIITPQRNGSSYLEVQVAAILLAVGISGIAPLMVVQSRQAVRVSERLATDETIFLAPAESEWQRRLGGLAEVSATAAPILTPDRDIRIISNHMSAPEFATYLAPGAYWYWVPYYDPLAYGNGVNWYYRIASLGSYAQWLFTNVQPGYYEVYTTHSNRSFWHSAAPFVVSDNNSFVGHRYINQQLLPNDFSYDGQTWELIDTVRVVSGTLRVRLVDSTGGSGFMAANAVLIRPVDVVSVQAMTPATDTQASATLQIVTP